MELDKATARSAVCSSALAIKLKIATFTVLLLAVLAGCSSDSANITNIANGSLDGSSNDNSSGNSSGNSNNDATNTALLLTGTVNEIALALNNSVEVKSLDGQRAVVGYNSNGEYATEQLPGAGPWLLRVQLNQDRSLYGIAFADGTRNINTFSDISLRRWFSLESLNVDEEFESSLPIQRLPSTIEYDTSVTSIFVLIDLVLESYEVSGEDVISTPYQTDNQGLHAFLQGNSVVLEDGLVSFQVTDPNTDIQTETATTLEITSPLMETGAPPSIPGSVRAIGGDDDTITIVWEPSVDDVAVVGYVVLRDETLLGTTLTTPYPQFIDQSLSAGASARYVIVAVDGAGNSSPPSTPVVGSLNPTVDTTPPPAPTQLAFLSLSGSVIRLEWLPPAVTDVVSYKLFRSIGSANATLIQNVAITRASDTEIRNDQTYCYQVRAVDGSGNESALSNQICSPADQNPPMDNTVTAPTPNPTTSPDSSEPVGEWTIVDVDTLSCSSTLTQDQLTVGRLELTQGCFFIPENLVLASGSTLRLGQGVVLMFERNTALTVQGGTLTALGTQQSPVIFTGAESEPGFWGGIEFQSNSAGNTLDGVVVQYGGGGSVRAAVSTRQDGARFRMLNTLVRRNEGAAISFNSFGIRIEAFSGNRIQENDKVGDVIATEIHTLAGNTEYVDNTTNQMDVTRREFAQADIIIPQLGTNVSWAGVSIEEGSLTIEPGADLEMVPGSTIEVNGDVNIIGTAEQPIIVKGRPNSTLDWRGFLLSGPGDKNFNHALIIGAGEDRATGGAIEIDCRRGEAFAFSINNTEIIDSAGWGIFAEGTSCTYDIGANVIFSNINLGDVSIP